MPIPHIATYQYHNEQLVYDYYEYETVTEDDGSTRIEAVYKGKKHSENVVDAGIAIETCGTVTKAQVQSPNFADNLNQYATPLDEDALKQKIANRDKDSGKISYSKNYIETDALGNKNSIQYTGSFSNSDFKPTADGSYTTGRSYQILRVYSFMKLADGTVVLSDPIYINTYDIASKAQ